MSNTRQNAVREVDEFQSLNDPGEIFSNPQVLQFMRTLINIIRQSLAGVVRRDRAASQIILQSPSGRSFIVTVDDNGVIKTTDARG